MPRGISKNGTNKGWIKKGQKLSQETKAKISEGLRKSYQEERRLPWNKGKKMPKEVGEKISCAIRGKKRPPLTEEHKKKISDYVKKNPIRYWLGKNRSLKDKESISKSLKGLLEGEKNPAWLGGKSFEPYGIEFNDKLKEIIRKRDSYRCQECYRHQDELYTKKGKKYKLNIHHIDFNKKNSKKNNLISLCRSCHLQTNYDRENWIKYFKNKMIYV